MPWPLVPPDADFPSPIRRDPDHDWFAARVEMKGLVPPTEQTSMRFSVGDKGASVWLPVERMAPHHYAGVLISRFDEPVLDARWLENGGRKRSYSMPIKKVSKQSFEIQATVSTRDPGWLTFQVVGIGDSNDASAVVAPFAEVMPKMSDFSEYQALGGWEKLVSGKATIKVARHDGLKSYAVFIALQVPTKMYPASAVEVLSVSLTS